MYARCFKCFWLLLLIAFATNTQAQSDSVATNTGWQKGTLEISGYIEAYYVRDFNRPDKQERPSFIYSHNRNNQVTVNLAYLKLNYTAQRLRANLAIMAGTYSMANLAQEPKLSKNMFEANAGLRLLKKQQLWLDAGIFASHIGFESAVSKDCWNLTRSILAENSPYYESGVKLSYTNPAGNLTAAVLLLNGWQHIQLRAAHTIPSFGWQVQGTIADKLVLNSSAFIGNDKPDSLRCMRYFHNFYAIYNPIEQLGITLGFDAGAEQQSRGSKQYNLWYSPVVIVRAVPIQQLAIAARFEYYSDAHGVLIATNTPNGFQTFGYSLNVDVIPFKNALIRFEGRLFQSRDKVFERTGHTPSHFNSFIGISVAYSFAHRFAKAF